MTDRIELDLPPEPEPRPYNPYEPPRTPEPEAWRPPGDARLPVPFEDPERYPDFLARLFATVKLGYTRPVELADRVPATSSLGAPWLFNFVLGLPTGILNLFLLSLAASMVQSVPALAKALHQDPTGRLLTLASSLILGVFIGGAILHCMLWMWGVTRDSAGVEQTVRLYGYVMGLSALVGWIPVLGQLLTLVFLVFLGLGAARIHGAEPWRGICAVLLTPFLCCCCAVGLALAFR